MIWPNFDKWNSWLKRWKRSKEPDWKISIPDGHGNTASVVYKGTPLKVISANLHLRAGEAALLTLEVWAQHLEVVMGALDIEINIEETEKYVNTTRRPQ